MRVGARGYRGRDRAAAALVVAALFAGQGAGAEALSRADYAAHKRQIDADYRADEARCRPRSGHDLSLCLAQAQGRHKVALAELDYNATGTDADATRLAAVKRESEYAVAKERCDALASAVDRDRCRDRADSARAGATRTPPLRKY